MIAVGSLVVCIDDSIPPYKNKIQYYLDFQQWICKDMKYIVREVLENDGIVTSILLEGVNNEPRYFKAIGRMQEPSFRIERFRELQDSVNTEEKESLNEKLVLSE